MYILDEPTTGLSFSDVQQLIDVLLRLRKTGHSIIVIEHHMDVIKSADWVVDLGPEGGDRGGQIVAVGTPEDVAKVKGETLPVNSSKKSFDFYNFFKRSIHGR